MLTSCVAYDNRGYNGNGNKLPPGQAKKIYGGSAKDYAPGQVKKRNGY
nr:quinol oxidase subunit 4 [Chryseobacterium phosphatilyticum]